MYRTADDRWLQFTMVRGPDELLRMFDALGLGDIIRDDRFATPEGRFEHGDELTRLVQDVLLMRDSDEWLVRLAAAGVNANRVGVIEEALDDDMIKVNNMVVPGAADMNMPWVINHPVNVDSIRQVGPKRAPDLGEHSAEILRNLGYDDAEIERLRVAGVI